MDMIQRRDFLQSASANDPEDPEYKKDCCGMSSRLWLLVTVDDSEAVLSFSCRRVQI